MELENGFRTQIFSDAIRDGLGIELIDPTGTMLAEVFRCDADHTISLAVFYTHVPLNLIERLIELSRAELEPFEDGTPLANAVSGAPVSFTSERAGWSVPSP